MQRQSARRKSKNLSKNQTPNNLSVLDQTPGERSGYHASSIIGSDAISSSQRQGNHLQASHTLKKLKSKQFLSLGYGVNSYFDTLVAFIKLYALMSLINIGVIIIYYSYDGIYYELYHNYRHEKFKWSPFNLQDLHRKHGFLLTLLLDC